MAVSKTKKTVSDVSNNDNDNLNEKIKILEMQISKLLNEREVVQEQPESSKIAQDDYIQVMSLRMELLTLSTLGRGKGTLYNFTKFGQVKKIIYSDLVKIMEAHPNFVEEGFFYILDKRVRRTHGLDEIYEGILTKKQIEGIFDSAENAVETFKSATKSQQGLIVYMIIDKVVNRENVDMNIVDRLTRVSGIDIQEAIDYKRFIVETVMTKEEKKEDDSNKE
jgi:hypothetical protein